VANPRKEGVQQCNADTASGSQCKRMTTGEFCDSHAGQTRIPREQDSRKADSRPTDAWLPASTLPMPNKEAGWFHRYIRVSSLDNSDTKNASRRFREGWEPIVASEYPELAILSDIGSRWPEGVEIGGLLLCKIPAETIEARKKYYAGLNQNQLETADQGFMNEQNDPRMPKHNESTSRTSFRKG